MDRRILSPEEHLGFKVGDDRALADWGQIVSYYRMLGTFSPRFKVEEIGQSTEGRPFLLATITSPANHARLDEFRAIQASLADPRTCTHVEKQQYLEQARTVVAITLSIHATEVGGSQMGLELAYELATLTDTETEELLENTIVLIVPSLNPDGLELVVEWYRRHVGTPCEGAPPPFLYQRYSGHDNNRDWFMQTQKETRLVVQHVHNKWHPHIVLDQHQQSPDGPRMVLPPFVDPYDENVDPLIRQQVAWLGQTAAAELSWHGKTGVMTNVVYDAFSPSRAYQHYHGGVRILSEAASVKIASPVKRSVKDLVPGRGYDPRVATWNHPEPWSGGEWHLRDIVEYNKIVAWACIRSAAKYRSQWVKSFLAIHERAVSHKSVPFAYCIPLEQRDPKVAAELIEVLMLGGVEVHRARTAFTADGVDYGAGAYVVLLQQPYGPYAKTLLEKQNYPDLRLYPGGPPKKPYDITAHSLPIQMGVTTSEIRAPFKAELVKLIEPPHVVMPTSIRRLESRWLYLRPEQNRIYTALVELLQAGVKVHRLKFDHDHPRLPAGSLIVDGSARSLVARVSAEYGLRANGLLEADLSAVNTLLRLPRIGVYSSFVANPDEGWLRFILEEYGIPYTTLWDNDIRRGNLNDLFDSLVLPSASLRAINEGLPGSVYPPEYSGGLGKVGIESLREFVENGGTLIAIDQACDWAISELSLPVTNIASTIPEQEFFIPGSFLRVVLDVNHPLAYGMPREASVVFVRSPAFVGDETVRIVGRYPMVNPLLSGWALGAEKLFGRGALLECSVGKGKAILFGFRPHFRAQARGTYKILFNSLFYHPNTSQ